MFKNATIVIALSALTAPAFAFQHQAQFGYIDRDSYTSSAASYQYFFEDVSLTDTAWAEAPFMNRASYAGVLLMQEDALLLDDVGFGAFGRVHFKNKWFVGATVTESDVRRENILEGGFYYDDDAAKAAYIRFVQLDLLGNDDIVTVGAKNIYELANNSFLKVDASLSNVNSFLFSGYLQLGLDVDYYLTPQTGVGFTAALPSDSDVEDRFGVEVSHYLGRNFGVHAGFETGDDDTIRIAATVRF